MGALMEILWTVRELARAITDMPLIGWFAENAIAGFVVCLTMAAIALAPLAPLIVPTLAGYAAFSLAGYASPWSGLLGLGFGTTVAVGLTHAMVRRFDDERAALLGALGLMAVAVLGAAMVALVVEGAWRELLNQGFLFAGGGRWAAALPLPLGLASQAAAQAWPRLSWALATGADLALLGTAGWSAVRGWLHWLEVYGVLVARAGAAKNTH